MVLNEDQRRLLPAMLDLVLRPTSLPTERDAAVGRIAAITGGQNVLDVLNSLFNPTSARPAAAARNNDMDKPWTEWKAEHERLLESHSKLERRVAILEAERYLPLRPNPDDNGYIPYPIFFIGLLACRDWRSQDIIKDFCTLANVGQTTIDQWKNRNKVPFYYYVMLPNLPLGRNVEKRTKDAEWTPEMIKRLREEFKQPRVKQNKDIAKLLSREFNTTVSERSVHHKAFELGLLAGILRERLGIRKQSAKRTRAAAPPAPIDFVPMPKDLRDESEVVEAA